MNQIEDDGWTTIYPEIPKITPLDAAYARLDALLARRYAGEAVDEEELENAWGRLWTLQDEEADKLSSFVREIRKGLQLPDLPAGCSRCDAPCPSCGVEE